ncbi:MAG: beta-ketoacyl synthase N-terminal-like domain-containing protein, partial [Myxococcota bacterium]
MTSDPSIPAKTPIAVVGVSCLMPGSLDRTGFWSDILAGRDLITDVPKSHWLIEDYYDADPKARDKTYANRGAFLPDVDFDPLAWGVPPSIVPATDTCQLLALIVAQRVLEDATQGQFKDLDRERVSVMLGVTSAQELLGSMVSRLQKPIWQKSLRDMGLPESQVQDACDRIASHYVEWQESTFPGVLGNVVAGRIANRLDLHGTNCVTDAACASTFSALSMGVNELRLGEADMVVVGGADTMNDIFMYMCFSKTPALSASGDCRPFSDQADGTMLGEGIGMVALKRLDDAVKNGDRVYAVLRGVGTSSDGRAKSVYAPLPEGQARAVRRAYAQADFATTSVELVEAHGTGTKAGDAAEFGGLRQVFEEAVFEEAAAEAGDRKQWCALGSVKSQIGHTKAAAGAAGLVKAVLALHHKTLPPSIKIERPNPLMKLDESAFYLNTTARPWVRGADHPRRAGVSSFGFGGSNFHLALEEAPADSQAKRLRTSPTELVVVTADDAAELAGALTKLANEVAAADTDARVSSNTQPGALLRFLASSTQAAYDAVKGARAAVVAESEADLGAKLRKAAELATSDKVKNGSVSAPLVHVGFGQADGDVAFVFPGQGSQYVGMGGDLAMAHNDAIAVWDHAADSGLQNVVFPRPVFDEDAEKALAKTLTATENAQPAIGLTSASMLALVNKLGLRSSMTAGHSYGEVTALFAAGAMDQATFLRASQARGASMAEAAKAAGGGTMLAVSAKKEDVLKLVEGVDVVAANHNHPTQVVLSGSEAAIDEAAAKLKAAKKRATRLPVATAFHSPIVAGAVEPFAGRLSELAIEAPKQPTYCNATAAPYDGDPKAGLSKAIASPVRFVEQIEAMAAAGARTFVEVGPGSVLTGLVGRILKGQPHRAVSLDRKGRHGLTSLQDGLAQLVADGRALELSALWEEYEVAEDPRLTEKPRLVLKLNGSNYGKPYPPAEGAAGLPGPNAEAAPPASMQPRVVEKIVEVEKVVEVEKLVEVEKIVEVERVVHAPVAAAAPAAAHPFVTAQQETLEAHRAFQAAMAETHRAFLQAAQTGLFGMAGLAHGAPQLGAPAVTGPQVTGPQVTGPQVTGP